MRNLIRKLCGAAYHIVEQRSATESGHQVWQDLNEWFGSAEVSRTVIDYYRNKLNSIKLTQTSEANDYIDNYILCSSKVEAKKRRLYSWDETDQVLGRNWRWRLWCCRPESAIRQDENISGCCAPHQDERAASKGGQMNSWLRNEVFSSFIMKFFSPIPEQNDSY